MISLMFGDKITKIDFPIRAREVLEEFMNSSCYKNVIQIVNEKISPSVYEKKSEVEQQISRLKSLKDMFEIIDSSREDISSLLANWPGAIDGIDLRCLKEVGVGHGDHSSKKEAALVHLSSKIDELESDLRDFESLKTKKVEHLDLFLLGKFKESNRTVAGTLALDVIHTIFDENKEGCKQFIECCESFEMLSKIEVPLSKFKDWFARYTIDSGVKKTLKEKRVLRTQSVPPGDQMLLLRGCFDMMPETLEKLKSLAEVISLSVSAANPPIEFTKRWDIRLVSLTGHAEGEIDILRDELWSAHDP